MMGALSSFDEISNRKVIEISKKYRNVDRSITSKTFLKYSLIEVVLSFLEFQTFKFFPDLKINFANRFVFSVL